MVSCSTIDIEPLSRLSSVRYDLDMNQPKNELEMERLNAEHTRHAIAARISGKPAQSYLRDFIYGAIDGSVTTFAVVTGAYGAKLSNSIMIVLGVANLLADGFSMAMSNYLGTKASRQELETARREEEEHIRHVPEGEVEEIRQIYKNKGFEGETLKGIVEVITKDRDLWIDTMLKEELGMNPVLAHPVRAAWATFVAFVLSGAIPLIPFVVFYSTEVSQATLFLFSLVLTGMTFFGIGAMKSRYVKEKWFGAGLETLVVGGGAALLAFVVGRSLRYLIGNF